MIREVSPPKVGPTILLGSQAEQKIRGVIGGINQALPVSVLNGLRRFIVVKDLKSEDLTAPKKVEISERLTYYGEHAIQPYEVLYTGPFASLQQLEKLISQETLASIAPTAVIFAQDSESFVRPQPIKEHVIYNLDEGYLGARNRAEYVKQRNAEGLNIEYDYILGVENAQVYSKIGEDEAAVTDTAFVYGENREGEWAVAHSAGITFADGNHGLTLFERSAQTEFNVPAGHMTGAADKQDPHVEATGNVYSREELLIPPIATVIYQLSGGRGGR
jgi:hypothetical protein